MPALKKSVPFIHVLLFLCLFLTSNKSEAQVPKLSYRFSMNTSLSPARLQVELSFRGADSGITYVQLPDRWANQENLYKALAAFSLVNSSFRIERTADSSVRRIMHKPGEVLKIVYSLQQDWTGPLDHPKNYRAIINQQFIHTTGFGLLVTPQQKDSMPADVSLDWTAMPKRWTIANSFHTGSRKWNGLIKMGDLKNSIFVSGDYRLYSASIQGQPVHLAIRGRDWKFADTALLSAIGKVMTAERNFWNDHSEPYYLVTMTPFEGEGSFNGSCLHQSFLTGMTKEFELNGSIYGLLGHEYFHRWNGVVMMMKGAEEENYWFSEGFTEYYTYKLLRKAALISLEDYVAKTNSFVADYYLSPVRNQNKQALGENFWEQRDYRRLPYCKGFVYALLLDHMIAMESAGRYTLDDVLFAMKKEAEQGQGLTDESFLQIIKNLTGKDIHEQHMRLINEGQTIPVLSGSLGIGITDSLVEVSPFELGFDWDATIKAKTISGVVENSSAWHAGLRNGQVWRGGSIYFNDTAKPAMVRIEMDGKIKDIVYQPIGVKKERVRKFYVR
jgi:predicted metalloprotease with PDZ domain